MNLKFTKRVKVTLIKGIKGWERHLNDHLIMILLIRNRDHESKISFQSDALQNGANADALRT